MRHLFLLFVLVFGTQAKGAPFVIDESFTSVDFGKHFEIFVDQTGKLTLDDVRKGGDGIVFATPAKTHFGLTRAHYWVRIHLKNALAHDAPVMFEIPYPSLHNVRFYEAQEGGGFKTIVTGIEKPFGARPFDYKSYVFPLTLKANAEEIEYAEVFTEGSMQLDANLWTPGAFAEHVDRETMVAGLYFGIMIALFFYNLFLAGSTREIGYLYYSLFVASAFMLYQCWNGLAFQRLWPDSPVWNSASIGFFALQLTMSALMFTKEYLNLKGRSRLTNRIFNAALFVGVAIEALLTVADFRIGLFAPLAHLCLGCVLIMTATVKGVLARYRPAYFYGIAWFCMLCSGIVSTLAVIGVIPLNDFSRYSSQFGSALIVIMLSLGMGDKMNTLRKERYKAQKKLSDSLGRVLNTTKDMAIAKSDTLAGAIAARSIEKEAQTLKGLTIDLIGTDKQGRHLVSRFVSGGRWLDDHAPTAVSASHAAASLDLAGLKESTLTEQGLFTPIESQHAGRSFLLIQAEGLKDMPQEDVHFVGAVSSSLAVALDNIFHIHNLQSLVDQRTEQLRVAMNKQKFLLENMEQGILTFDAQLRVDDEFSAFVPRFFQLAPGKVAGQDVFDLVFVGTTLSSNDLRLYRESLEAIVGSEEFAWTMNSGHLPRQLEIRIADKEHTISLGWSPLLDDDQVINKIMLSVSDITAEIAAKRRLEAQKAENDRLMTVIGEALKSNRKSVVNFLRDATGRFDAVERQLAADATPDAMFRDLHTIKGGSRFMHLKALADAVHEVEDLLKGGFDKAAFGACLKKARAVHAYYLNVVENVLGGGVDDGQAAQSGDGVALEGGLTLHGFAAQMLPTVSKALAVGELELGGFTLRDQVMSWSVDGYQAVSAMILHAVNNSCDHGYVLPGARGEPVDRKAHFDVLCELVDDRVRIVVSDLGRGFNLDKIKKMAQEKGFKPADGSEEALLAVLFESGMSTAEQVSQSSGRGVGMSAIDATARELGGKATIRRNSPRGAQVEILLPRGKVVAGGVRTPTRNAA